MTGNCFIYFYVFSILVLPIVSSLESETMSGTRTTITVSTLPATTEEMSEREKKLAIVDDLNDVIDKIDDTIGTASTTTSARRRYRAASMTCSLFDETLDDLIDIASDTSEQKNIATYADSLTTADVESCSDAELANLESDKESLEAIVADYQTSLSTCPTTYTTGMLATGNTCYNCKQQLWTIS